MQKHIITALLFFTLFVAKLEGSELSVPIYNVVNNESEMIASKIFSKICKHIKLRNKGKVVILSAKYSSSEFFEKELIWLPKQSMDYVKVGAKAFNLNWEVMYSVSGKVRTNKYPSIVIVHTKKSYVLYFKNMSNKSSHKEFYR